LLFLLLLPLLVVMVVVLFLLVLFQRLQLPAAPPRRSNEGFYEDLALQNTVARRFQR
jgi:hypothetical protein